MPSCHRYREWCFALLLLLLTPLALRGQAPDRFFICDPTRDHIVTLRDVDGDGEFNSPGESSIYYSDLSSGPNLSVPVGLNPFKGGLLLLDGGTLDSILWLRDLDGDQTANSEDEWQIFYDNSSPGPDLVVPRAITVASNGEIFIADEGSAARRVLRLFDSNDDGDALDSGESVIYFDSESFSPSVPISEPISIAVGGDGSVYVGDSFHNWVFRCNDFDGDGTANGEEECAVFYSPPTNLAFDQFDALSIDHLGRLVIVDGPSGSVLICEDFNGDGDGMDPGESILIVDGAAVDSQIADPRAILPISPGQFLLGDSALDGLYRIEDLDGDGTISGALEQLVVFDDDGVSMPNPTGLALLPGTEITAVEPAILDALGGETLSITGHGWAEGEVVAIEIGPLSLTGTAISSSLLDVVLPPGTPGHFDVSVIASGGTAILPDGLELAYRILRGDVDGDSSTALNDGILIISYLVGISAEPITCLDTADVNDDGSVDLSDVIHLLSYLFIGGDLPVPPFPSAGFDPTSGVPGCDFPA